MKISFNVEEIRLLPLVPMVDYIELDLQSSSEGYSALLDGLPWSCHPKILSAEFMDLESQRRFIMALLEIADKFYLTLEHSESIHDVEFHDGDGRPLNWSALSDVTPKSQRSPKLHIAFKW